MNPHVDAIKTRLRAFDDSFSARTVRERAVFGAGIAAVLFFSIDSIGIRPVTEKIDRADLAIERTENTLVELEKLSRSLNGAEMSEEEKRFFERKKRLQAQLGEIDSQIAAEISELVPPQAIVSVLEEILAPIRSLQIINVQSQEPYRLGSGRTESKSSASMGALYRHSVRIEIEGDFAATVEFLKQAENSRWNLLWDRLEYQVDEFPTATITLDIHTISDQEEWIGV